MTTQTSTSTPGSMPTAGTAGHLPDHVLDADRPAGWLTASVRPAGDFGRHDVGRLRALLDALSACASIVVLDLQAAHLRSPRIAAVIDDAARRLERGGGCLLCVNTDPDSAAHLAGSRAVVMPDAPAHLG